MKKIVILGSTGSIGTQTLDVIEKNPDKFKAVALTCHGRIDALREQIVKFSPEAVCVGRKEDAETLSTEFPTLKVYHGEEGLAEIAVMECDMVLNSLLGISGLVPTYRAIEAGRDIALANKETLVTGGSLIMDLVKEKGVSMLPVDSEHSAIFQALQGSAGNGIERILLTASGGPFRGWEKERLRTVTRAQALKHPSWTMGAKITIDSATMMNKGFEVIEAKWLFDVDVDKIDIVVHPQSIIHSAVEFKDHSVIAQMGNPDMRVPIAYALTYPERYANDIKPLSLAELGTLTFEKPDEDTFMCLRLAREAMRKGGNAACALNGANEVLVKLFLEEKIGFMDIPETIEKVMEKTTFIEKPSLSDILETDREARALVSELI